VKYWNPKMIPVTTSKKITGDTIGRLTCRNFANRWPLQIGRLIEVLGHVEEPREEDDHRVAHAPEAEEDESRLRPLG
jgi:hypothetical protein